MSRPWVSSARVYPARVRGSVRNYKNDSQPTPDSVIRRIHLPGQKGGLRVFLGVPALVQEKLTWEGRGLLRAAAPPPTPALGAGDSGPSPRCGRLLSPSVDGGAGGPGLGRRGVQFPEAGALGASRRLCSWHETPVSQVKYPWIPSIFCWGDPCWPRSPSGPAGQHVSPTASRTPVARCPGLESTACPGASPRSRLPSAPRTQLEGPGLPQPGLESRHGPLPRVPRELICMSQAAGKPGSSFTLCDHSNQSANIL